ncbi:transposase [Puniceicoccaceae bacterium K14]|nr:transposase [Puniceicoccaceae bacterium K14]
MRQARIKIEGKRAVYHCMTRVVGGEFLLGEREKEILRKQLWNVAGFCGVEVLTYCLMSNHFHVLVRTPLESEIENMTDLELLRRAGKIYSADKVDFFKEMLSSEDESVSRNYRSNLKARMGDISLFMKELKQRFSIWFNRTRKKKRVGTLWAERFKSVLVEDDPFALMTVAAYIDLNSVRAGLVTDPSEYRFCGYGEAMAGSKSAKRGIRLLAGRRINMANALEQYRVVVFGKGYASKSANGKRAVDGDKAKKVLEQGGRVEMTEALRCRVRYFTDGAVIGSNEFVQSYFETNRANFGIKRRDGPRKLRGSDWGGLSCIRDLRNEVFS